MGADLILTCIPWPVTTDDTPIPPGPKLVEATMRRLIRLPDNEDVMGELVDGWANGDDIADELPSDDPTDDEVAAAQGIAIANLAKLYVEEFFGGKAVTLETHANGSYLAAHYRDCDTMKLGGRWHLFSGGTSWGDSPGDSFAGVNFLATVQDFIDDPYTPEELA